MRFPSRDKSTKTSRSERFWKPNLLLLLGGIGLPVVVLGGVWRLIANDNPVVSVPQPAMPNPNAFDFYVLAGKAIVGRNQIDDTAYSKPKVPMTSAQKEALLQQNAGAIQALRQGFAYTYHNPPIHSFFMTMPYLRDFQSMARLLALESQVRAAHGNWGGAADSALDAIRMGEDIPRGGGVTFHYSGDRYQEVGQKSLWQTVDRLNQAQTLAALQRLQAIMERQVAYADTMQEQKWATQRSLMEWFRTTSPSAFIREQKNNNSDNGYSDETIYSAAFCLFCGKKRSMEGYTTMMDANIARVRQPYSARPPPPPIPNDTINQMMFSPAYDNAWFRAVETETQNGLLLLTLALQAYHLEHGRFPETLVELTPAYLKKLPTDPFALRGSFVYRNMGERYLLYSVGPDGRDDGGKRLADPHDTNASSFYSYRAVPESLGDIVAGTNLP